MSELKSINCRRGEFLRIVIAHCWCGRWSHFFVSGICNLTINNRAKKAHIWNITIEWVQRVCCASSTSMKIVYRKNCACVYFRNIELRARRVWYVLTFAFWFLFSNFFGMYHVLCFGFVIENRVVEESRSCHKCDEEGKVSVGLSRKGHVIWFSVNFVFFQSIY